MTERCVWCHQAGGGLSEISVSTPGRFGTSPHEWRTIVHAEHEAAFRAYNDRVARFGRLFLLLLGALLLATIVLEFVLLKVSRPLGIAGIGAAVGLAGVVILSCPIATPETIRAFGARTSIRLVRSAGALLIAAGGVVAALALA